MTLRIDNKKWILYRHTSDFSLLCEVATILKSYSKTTISRDEKVRLNQRLRELGLYSERNPDLPLDAINHKINQLAYYMFGYKAQIDNTDRFLYSPLGNLFLKHIEDKVKSAKIFLAMLWSVQFQHPHGGTDKEFQLYPFRLIFKLLSDERLSYKLFAFEVAYAVVFIKEVTTDIYENLITELLQLRLLSDNVLAEMFQKDRHAYVNSAYEWDYYVSTLFSTAGILTKTQGAVICSLQHGNTPTFRKVTRNEVYLRDEIKELALIFESQYSFLDKPLQLNDPERLRIDVVKEIYSFYPVSLLTEIGEVNEASKLLELPKLIEQYSNNPDNGTAYLFEDVLVEGFNMFYNVEARGIGGAGHTDIECLYLSKRKKFAVESKSTANKLSGINVGRLREHREEIGGEYTIIVTPRYVPAAKRDIYNTPNVIVLASTFAEYLYNCIDNDLRDVDYEDFDGIIVDNLGKDISKNISDLTIARFATSRI